MDIFYAEFFYDNTCTFKMNIYSFSTRHYVSERKFKSSVIFWTKIDSTGQLGVLADKFLVICDQNCWSKKLNSSNLTRINVFEKEQTYTVTFWSKNLHYWFLGRTDQQETLFSGCSLWQIWWFSGQEISSSCCFFTRNVNFWP